MPTIYFKDIDTNGNGYLDRNEIAAAKQKGVKRELYIGMTASDIKNNVTREQKINSCLGKYDDETVFRISMHFEEECIKYKNLSDEELEDKMLEEELNLQIQRKEADKRADEYIKEAKKSFPWYIRCRNYLFEKLGLEDLIPYNQTHFKIVDVYVNKAAAVLRQRNMSAE